MPIDSIEEQIPPQVQELIAVFRDKLGDITFPDVSYAVLEELIEQVRERSAEFEDIKTKIDAAQEAVEEAQRELQQKCLRGLAYAKVFAEGNEELSAQLAAISFGKPSRAPKKPTVERTRKQHPVPDSVSTNVDTYSEA